MAIAQHYFWRPVPDAARSYGMVRHAFHGAPTDIGSSATALCGWDFGIAASSEMDWILAPTCSSCNDVLKRTETTSCTAQGSTP